MSAEDKGEIIIYQSEDGNVQLDVRLENETVWLTQDQLCMLFNKAKSTISEHISNIFKEWQSLNISVVEFAFEYSNFFIFKSVNDLHPSNIFSKF